MAGLTKKLMKRVLGTGDPREEGIRRTLRGLREGDRRQLYLGMSLTALAYLRNTRPRRRLLFSDTVPPGSAIVVHHKRRGDPAIEVVKP